MEQNFELNKQAFGVFLAQLRREKGWTQKDLAEKLYVSDKAVSKWERGLSVPDVSLLLPLAELLGVSVTELLEGRRLEEAAIPADEVEVLVKKALTLPTEPAEVKQERVKKYLPTYLACNVLGAVEALMVWNLGWMEEKMQMLLWMSCGFGFLFGAYFFFTEEVLPGYYDENRINYVTQGIFRMNIPGVYFNNRNWPVILRWGRIWTVVTAVAMPLLLALGTWAGKMVGKELCLMIWLVYLVSMAFAIIVPARKYEFGAPKKK
ncbi:hypothetical protein CHR60_12835 [Faecalibacterium prausnitzii]|uniref:HTH cro/C1-type domain-containing protein n=1 Tax=Faecalibacterium prausnitzii TaxID=853 RepID=A0A2A7B3G6_9FIRM|nr:helix-turn-helix domain-containing protein [Faecalibacterium prausnitzii]PDX85899.1 hypothetical protein CHR60_12835 [Faecalibacterium prausnitzii]